MRTLPSLFGVALLLLWTSTPGHSRERDTQKCYEDKGMCHSTLCPAQKIEKGTCNGGSQLCCVGHGLNLSTRLCWQRGGQCRSSPCFDSEVEISTCYQERLKCCREKT